MGNKSPRKFPPRRPRARRRQQGQAALIFALGIAAAASALIIPLAMNTVLKTKSMDSLGYLLDEANLSAIEKMGQALNQRLLYPTNYYVNTNFPDGNRALAACSPPAQCLYVTLTNPSDLNFSPRDWEWNRTSQTFTVTKCDPRSLGPQLPSIFQPFPTFPDPTASLPCTTFPTTTVSLVNITPITSQSGNNGVLPVVNYRATVSASTPYPDGSGRNKVRSAFLDILPPPALVQVNQWITPPIVNIYNGDATVTFYASYTGMGNEAYFNCSGPAGQTACYTGNGGWTNFATPPIINQLPGCETMDGSCTTSFTVTVHHTDPLGNYNVTVVGTQNWPGGIAGSGGWYTNFQVVSEGPGASNFQCNITGSVVSPYSMRNDTGTNTISWQVSNYDNVANLTAELDLLVNAAVTPTMVLSTTPSVPAGTLTTSVGAGNAVASAYNNYQLTVWDTDSTTAPPTVNKTVCTYQVLTKQPQSCCRAFCNFNGLSQAYVHVFIPCLSSPPCFDVEDPLCSAISQYEQYWGPTQYMPNQIADNDGLTYQVWSGSPTSYNPPADDCGIFNYTTPLIIDMSGKGIRIDNRRNHAVAFDITGSGDKHSVAWPENPENMFLIYDRNYDRTGKYEVRGANELFGNATRGPDGNIAEDGFAALAKYDANHDGRIDRADPVFSKLRLWSDRNHNGRVDEGELYTLREKGITTIWLRHVSTDEKDGAGNLFNLQAEVILSDGSHRKIIDAVLNDYTLQEVVDNYDAIHHATPTTLKR